MPSATMAIFVALLLVLAGDRFVEIPRANNRRSPGGWWGRRWAMTAHCCGAVMSEMGRVSRATPVHTAVRNCTRDEGGPFEVGNQVLISSHRKLLSSKAMVVNVAEKSALKVAHQSSPLSLFPAERMRLHLELRTRR